MNGNTNSTETSIIGLILSCDAPDKNKMPIKINANSTVQGTFNFSFTPLAQFNKIINCTIITNATD